MFGIENIFENGISKIVLSNNDGAELLKIIPEYCGMINELILPKGDKAYLVIDGYKTPDDLKENPLFKGAILLPFPNRLKNGKYTFEGGTYQFPINDDLFNTAIHGFFYGRKMVVEEKLTDNQTASVTLKNSYSGEYDYFPFYFDTYLKYTISESEGFICNTRIVNTGDNPMPIGIGWHPYLTFGEKADDLFLKIPDGEYNQLDKQMIPTGETYREERFRTSEKINNYNFNTGLKLEQQTGKVFTEIFSPEKDARINFWQESGDGKFAYLQLYIPPSRDSIAIEPMTCNVDAFNNRDGLVILAPDCVFTASFGLTVS